MRNQPRTRTRELAVMAYLYFNVVVANSSLTSYDTATYSSNSLVTAFGSTQVLRGWGRGRIIPED